jgi:hypothetical protein
VGDAIVELENKRVDKEMALVGLNTVARKAEQVRRGPVNTILIKATDPMRTKALCRRADRAYTEMMSGRSLADVIHAFDFERKQAVEKGSSALLSKLMNKEVTVEITKVGPLGRKKERWGRFWVLDMDVDVKVTIDGQTTLVQGVGHEAVPKATIQGDSKLAALLLPACLPVLEISLAGHTIINATIPAAVAAVLGKVKPGDVGKIAEEAAFISAGVPGVKNRAEEVASRAILIAKAFDEP